MARSVFTNQESNARWDRLYANQRHRLLYPSEPVVRFLAHLQTGWPPGTPNRALDIGCGAGRHTRLLNDFGYVTTAIDSSSHAVELTQRLVPAAHTIQASMTDLPFMDGSFDVVIAANTLYYGTLAETARAIQELHRVLSPRGHAFVVVRTEHDSRFDPFLAKPADETGMTYNAPTEDMIESDYAIFATVNYELTETTRHKRTWVDSDWLITLTK